MKDSVGYLVLLVSGAIVATVGSVAYRSIPPFGVALAIVMVAFAAVFARAWLSWTGLGLFAAVWMSVTFVWTLAGPGGSVLIAADTLGYAWLAGGVIAIVVAALLPKKLLVGEHVEG
ncbi:hypothetical protein [Demequina sp. NBRC 110051]|uniref:hypothetical protein n=1 Tax=Demequina sp. NBRC 110051 TaxID=1570340 RepID=UPI000A0282BB|nr:hypothetical protein [Demequina sp. NBRC 110051]